MKNVVSVVGVFFGVLVFGTLIGAAIFMIYGNLTLFVAGTEPANKFLNFFVMGLTFSFPIFCVLASMMSILYLIRHNTGSIFTLIAVFVLNVLIWLLVLPQVLCLGNKHYSSFSNQDKKIVSKDFFRDNGNGVIYITKISDENLISGILIDVDGLYGTKGIVYKIVDVDPARFQKKDNFADPLIAKSTRVPAIIEFPLSLYLMIFDAAIEAWERGFLHWLSFASVALVFIACYGLKFVSDWKLLSGAWVATIYGFTLFFNGYVRSGGIFLDISERFSTFWSERGLSIDEPLVFFVNILLTLVLTALGIILYFYRRHMYIEGAE